MPIVEQWRGPDLAGVEGLALGQQLVEYEGTRVGPYTLKIPARALRNGDPAGTLATLRLPRGDVLLTYTPPRPEPSR